MIRDSIATIERTGTRARIAVRADSAYYNTAIVNAIIKAGAAFSITVRMHPAIRRRNAQIPATGWTRITYTQAIPDPDTGELISAAEVSQIDYTAFTSQPRHEQVTTRLVVRRVPELSKTKLAAAGREGPTWESFPTSGPSVKITQYGHGLRFRGTERLPRGAVSSKVAPTEQHHRFGCHTCGLAWRTC